MAVRHAELLSEFVIGGLGLTGCFIVTAFYCYDVKFPSG